MIRRPGTSSEDGKVFVVLKGVKHWVVTPAWFAAHGFNFPADVLEVTVAELDAIPTGEALQ